MRKAKAPIYITHTDLGDLMGIPTRTILRWAKSNSGGFPSAVKVVDRTYVFNRREVEAWFRLQPADSGAGPSPG